MTIDGSNGHRLVGNSTGYGVPVVVLSDEDDVSSEITDVNNSVESQEDDSEIQLTTTTPLLPVTLPFNMDYYRSRKSTDRQPSYTIQRQVLQTSSLVIHPTPNLHLLQLKNQLQNGMKEVKSAT